MYSGTSGLKVHGEGMTVIRQQYLQRVDYWLQGFEHAVRGRLEPADIHSRRDWAGRSRRVHRRGPGRLFPGSVESTTSSTDLSIGGNGFFVVSPAGQEMNYYTRAGNFSFDEDGYLVDTNGYRVQGWEVLQEDSSVAASGESTKTESHGREDCGRAPGRQAG